MHARSGVLHAWAVWCVACMGGVVCCMHGRCGVLHAWAVWCVACMGGAVCCMHGRCGVLWKVASTKGSDKYSYIIIINVCFL